MGAKISRLFGGHSSTSKDDSKKPKRWGSLRRQKSEERHAPERSATLPARPRPPESAVKPSVPPTVAEGGIDELQKATVSKPVESAPPLPQPTIVPEYIEDKTFKTDHKEPAVHTDHTAPVVERVAAKSHVEAAAPQPGTADAAVVATVVPIGDAKIGDTDFEKPPGGQLDLDAEQTAKEESDKVMYIQHDMAVHVEEPFTSIAEPGSTETPSDQPEIVQYSSAMHVQPDFPHSSTIEPGSSNDMVIGEPEVALKANSPELIVESTVSDSNAAVSTVHAKTPLAPEHADAVPSDAVKEHGEQQTPGEQPTDQPEEHHDNENQPEEPKQFLESEDQAEQHASLEQIDEHHASDEQHQEKSSEAVESESQVEQHASPEQVDEHHTADCQPQEATSEPVESDHKAGEHHSVDDQQDTAEMEHQTEEHDEIEAEHSAEHQAPSTEAEEVDTSAHVDDDKPLEQDGPENEQVATEGTADDGHEEGIQHDIEDKHTEESHDHESEQHAENDGHAGHGDDIHVDNQHEVEATEELPKSEDIEGEAENTRSCEAGDHVDDGAVHNSISEGEEEHVSNVVDDAINSSLLELSSGKLEADANESEHQEAGDVVENHEQ